MARSKKKPWAPWLPTIIAVLATIILMVTNTAQMKDFFQHHLWDKVAWPMARLLFYMGLGLSVAMLIEALGWTVALGRLAAPLTRRARLPMAAAASFTTALVSSPAANGLLSEALDKKEISPKALAVANLLNGSWPSFIVHLPTTLAVSTSLAGRAGLAYTLIMFSAATLRLAGAAVLGRLILPRPEQSAEPDKAGSARKSFKEIWPALKTRLRRRLTTLASLAAPVYYLVTLAAAVGFFEALQRFSASHLPDFFLPVEAAALIVFSLTAEFSSGFVAAGALIQNSTLTVPQAAAALVLGNIIATPIRVLRWQLGPFIGYFKTRLGLTLIVCNQAFRVTSLVIALFIFWQIFG
ncbi:hypothetical protein LJB99_05010 [Deltaproteobacteria bacterium OttesenSCG-928-K17]|nr:hypothetical protein [Deltaproteobacteria bacterium OttesenSCG-928-K17]